MSCRQSNTATKVVILPGKLFCFCNFEGDTVGNPFPPGGLARGFNGFVVVIESEEV